MPKATTVTLPQDTDTPPRKEETPVATLLLTSRRSHEGSKSNLPNEDYLAFRYDEECLVVVLCDGVGQSFFGDLAARFLGDKLLEWLWALKPDDIPDNDKGGAKLAEKLFNDLHAWTTPATELVKDHPLPKDRATSLRRIALERKRDDGSASVFACARLDFSAEKTSCLGFWLGNTRLRFWGARDKALSLASDNTVHHEQWSTAKGPLNSDVVHHIVLPSLAKRKVQRLTLHTDGVHQFEDELSGLTLARLKEILRELKEDVASDDVSLLDVVLKKTSEGNA